MRAPAVLIGLALALAACRADPVAAPPSDAAAAAQVAASRVEGGVLLVNGTDRPVAFHVRDPNWLGLLAACADPGPACARLAPGASLVVPLAGVAGYAPGTSRVTVTWWHVVPDGDGGNRVEELHEVTLGV